MARLALCMAGLLLAWVVAEAQTYSPPPSYTSPSPPYYSSPPPTTQTPPSVSSSKKQLPLTPPAKKNTPPPPPPPPKKYTPPPPPPKKSTPPPPPPKKHTPPPPPPKKHTPPPPPPKKHTPPPPPPTYSTPPLSPPVVASPPASTPAWPSPPPLPPATPAWPSPPPTNVPTPPSTPAWPSPPPNNAPTTPAWPSPPPLQPATPAWPSPPPTDVPTSPSTPTWPSPPPPTYVPTPPSTPTWPSSPPPASAVAAKKVRCKNKAYSTCYFRQFTCPADCPNSCEVDCHTCSPVCNCNKPGAVCQDPRFIGADGITFYFHGKKNRDFCLVSDPNLHINAHFIGKRNPTMGRDFTWVQSLGILFDDHTLYIGARKTATWNEALDHLTLIFDGQPIDLNEFEGATWESSNGGDVKVTRSKATNAVEIEIKNKLKMYTRVVPITEKESLVHKYGITQEDCFAHLDLSFKFYSLSGEVSGVLGQTYGRNYVSRVKMGISMPVVGGEKKFSTSSLFATDCSVSRFVGEDLVNDEGDDNNSLESGHLNCATGINGSGVVCKR